MLSKRNRLVLLFLVFLSIPFAVHEVSASEAGIALNPSSDERFVEYMLCFGVTDNSYERIDPGSDTEYRCANLQPRETCCFDFKPYGSLTNEGCHSTNILVYTMPTGLYEAGSRTVTANAN